MMKRPFACIGFTCLFTLAAVVFILKEWVFSLAVIAGVLGALSLLAPVLRRGRVVPLSLLTAAFSLVWLGCWMPGYEGDQKLAGSDYHISGQITEAPERSGEKFAYVLRVDSATDPEKERFNFPESSGSPASMLWRQRRGTGSPAKFMRTSPARNSSPIMRQEGSIFPPSCMNTMGWRLKSPRGKPGKGIFSLFVPVGGCALYSAAGAGGRAYQRNRAG